MSWPRWHVVWLLIAFLLTASVSFSMRQEPLPLEFPHNTLSSPFSHAPFVILQQGDTTWLQVHTDSTSCPGDAPGGHGGEATGGPNSLETWCFEGGPGDSCGTNPPWDTRCFNHVDVMSLPSPNDINYWHIDTYRTDQRPYCGSYCLWCGSGSLWQGRPVECGTWENTPGYGNNWDCIVRLDLDSSFTVTTGCTLCFDQRYDGECKYDYFYAEFWDGDEWQTLATFNATSNNPGPECGEPTGGSPDYWANTDTGQPLTCDWQERPDPLRPAFVAVIQEWRDSTLLDSVSCAPSFRWRFNSDLAYSDADGALDTDGGAFIDNVWVFGDPGNTYIEDFEHGNWNTLEARGWGKPDPAGRIDAWHVYHDSDPPYEGDDGGDRRECVLDSSYHYRSRPIQGYPTDKPWRCGWHYRLLSPVVPIPEGYMGTGCVVQYDMARCCLEYACDFTDTKVRFFDSDYGTWCPWISPDGISLDYGGCWFWEIDRTEDVSRLYDSQADSMQFGWDAIHLYEPGSLCCNKGSPGKNHNLQIDNVSIGFFNGSATVFAASGSDLLHDTFYDSVCAYNSFFDTYDPETLRTYAGPPYTPPLPKRNQLYVDIYDRDGIQEVRLYGSIDDGSSWQYVVMQLASPSDPEHPDLGGEYYGTFCPTDFGLARWDKGTEVRYYVRCVDETANTEYFPSTADPSSPDHTGECSDYFEFSILPMYPPGYDNPRLLLVDGYGGMTYDPAECFALDNNLRPLEDIYAGILRDAGYCYDRYDIHGAGSNIHIHPLHYSLYDAIVWFCGPHLTNHLFDREAQLGLRGHLSVGGKILFCGDRIAYNLAPEEEGGIGQDSIGGEFLAGVMGCDYMAEMESPFSRPYVYLEAADSLELLGSWITLDMDSLLVYRECPDARDMSYVVTNEFPPAGYTAQPLLHMLDPDPYYEPAEGAIYVEKPAEGGQCVFIDYDLSSFVTHKATYCAGSPLGGQPPYQPGYYYGRVELVRLILERLFGLPSLGAGQGGTADVKPRTAYRWGLAQNTPNPCTAETEIRFEVGRTGQVSITVYDATGRLVRMLEKQRFDPGVYSVRWDGKNHAGQRVASGLYFYRMQTDGFTATRKMLVLR